MDSKGFDNGGLGERYPSAAEPNSDEALDDLPLRRPDLGYVFDLAGEGSLPLPARPIDADRSLSFDAGLPHDAVPARSEYRTWVDEAGYDPDRYPSEPYVASPRAGRPYVTQQFPAVTDRGSSPLDQPFDLPLTQPRDQPWSGADQQSDAWPAAPGWSPARTSLPSAPVSEPRDPANYRSRHSAPEGATPERGRWGPVAAPGAERPYQLVQLDDGTILRPGHAGHDLAENLADLRRRELTPDDRAERDRHEARTPMPLWQELPLLLVVAFCVAVLIRSFLVQAFFIPSSSMEQTLLIGDRVLVNKVLYDLRDPRRGEVVVFRGTDRWAPENYDEPATGLLDRIGDTLGDLVGVSRPGEKDFIKRVIGLPGDRVECCDAQGRVMVNGVGIDEPYINANSPLDMAPSTQFCGARRFAEVVVPPGQLFVMGDNRAVSQDSRCQGPVPIDHVIGRAFMVVWPSDRWSTIGLPDVYGAVPATIALGSGAALVPADPMTAVIVLPSVAAGLLAVRARRRWHASPAGPDRVGFAGD